MKKTLLIALLFIFCGLIANAQVEYKKEDFKPNQTSSSSPGFDASKLSFGGNLGFGFGSNNYWGVLLNPQIGYKFAPKLTAGAGLSYFHSSEKGNNWTGGKWKYSRDYVGFNFFANYYPIDWIVLTAKPEIIRMWQTYTPGNGQAKVKSDDFVPTFVVGAGVRFRPFMLTLNYDIVQDKNTPYGDGIYFGVGLQF